MELTSLCPLIEDMMSATKQERYFLHLICLVCFSFSFVWECVKLKCVTWPSWGEFSIRSSFSSEDVLKGYLSSKCFVEKGQDNI